MHEHPHTRTQSITGGQAARHIADTAAFPAPASAAVAHPAAPDATERGEDPVTDWLLRRDDLDTTEFDVLFAIHKLRARRRTAGWIGYTELRRCTGLAPDALGRVLAVLRQRGLIWSAPHPVKLGYSRYVLLVQ